MILESLQQNDEVESVEPMADRPQWREWAKEEIAVRRREMIVGSLVGERVWHRAWPPDAVLAFLAAPVIRPPKGEIQKKLYPKGFI